MLHLYIFLTLSGILFITRKKDKNIEINKNDLINVYKLKIPKNISMQKLKKLAKKYSVITSGTKSELALNLWKLRASSINSKDLLKIYELLPKDIQKEANKKISMQIQQPITNYKGMWSEKPKPLNKMTRDELIKHLKNFRNAWEKITTRNQDLNDERLKKSTNSQLKTYLKFYYSNDAKLIAEDWLLK